MLDRRVHYRRQNHYATKSNKYKIVKTPGKLYLWLPTADCLLAAALWKAIFLNYWINVLIVTSIYVGGRLTIQYLKRRAGRSIAGVPRLRSPALRQLTVTKRTVARPYGGKLTHSEVRDKILRAFLIEEVKQMKRLMQQKEKSSKKSKKSKAKGKKKAQWGANN